MFSFEPIKNEVLNPTSEHPSSEDQLRGKKTEMGSSILSDISWFKLASMTRASLPSMP